MLYILSAVNRTCLIPGTINLTIKATDCYSFRTFINSEFLIDVRFQSTQVYSLYKLIFTACDVYAINLTLFSSFIHFPFKVLE